MQENYFRFTDRSVDSVNHYLNDINRRKFEPLSNQEEHDLGIRAMQGNKEARERLINANLRYVVSVAKRYQSSEASFEDLIQAGNEGLVKAVDRFDPTLNLRLISYATWYIQNEVRKTAYAHMLRDKPQLDDYVDDDKQQTRRIDFIEGKGYTKVLLRPLMVVAGDHANNDMAAEDDPESWYSILTAKGYDVTCVLEGLGQLEDIRSLYVSHAQAVMEGMAE